MKKWFLRIVNFLKGTADEHIDAFAGQTTFFLFLSFFPLLNILLALTPYLPFSEQEMADMLLKAIPENLSGVVRDIISDIYNRGTPTLTIISILMGVWSAAKGTMAIRNGLNEVYRGREKANTLIVRGISAIYTVIFILILVGLIFVNLFGRQIFTSFMEKHEDFQAAGQLIVKLSGVGTYLILFLVILGIYTFLPKRKLLLRYQIFGAMFTAGAWMLVFRGFAFYMDYAMKKSQMYGSLSTFIMLLLWLYLMVSLIFWGAQINEFLYEYVFKEKADKLIERKYKKIAIRKARMAEKQIRFLKARGWKIPKGLAKKYPELVNPPEKKKDPEDKGKPEEEKQPPEEKDAEGTPERSEDTGSGEE